jgi:putative transposase
LLEQGWVVNRKRVQRLWREEGLRVPARRRKRQRLGESTVPADRLRPDHVWAIDFQFDQAVNGRAIKLLNIVDEFTREALAMDVATSITADDTVKTLERLARERGAPGHVRCDNGPELTAHALRDWCRFSKAETAFIEPGAPWQNPFVESFNARVRDELLDVEQFSCLAEARVVIGDYRDDYNRRRPHSALGMQAPATFAAAWTPPADARRTSIRCRQDHQPTINRLSLRADRQTGAGHPRWSAVVLGALPGGDQRGHDVRASRRRDRWRVASPGRHEPGVAHRSDSDRRHPGSDRITAQFAQAAKHYGVEVWVCPPRRPQRIASSRRRSST